jgi:hypothetical protein
LKKLFLIIFFFTPLQIAFCQLPNYWQQQVNYKIDVTLNDEDHTLDAYLKMEYWNNSPDTLKFIWIHLWPNAYKNDRTAFNDQQLENGNTAFYFSSNEQRGYINRLDFKINGSIARMEDHPQHQDIIKLILPQPLPPKSSCKIETPFHVKLPEIFSRSGHKEQSYQITQWYPKPAVYDRDGWHPMPYLDQGEFYSEFGNFEVQITLPENYVVAATGNLISKGLLQEEHIASAPLSKKKHASSSYIKKDKSIDAVIASGKLITLLYTQNNVHDFAWFADKSFIVKKDTLRLPSGKIISLAVYYYDKDADTWQNSVKDTKNAILTKSNWIGEYPYDIVSVVSGGNGGGMEYPTITLIESVKTEKMLDILINHEVGHNWFYGILASNERQHPWMDEGMNTYYDNRYILKKYGDLKIDFVNIKPSFLQKGMPDDISQTLLQTLITLKRDQPIQTISENFSTANYEAIAYAKTGNWMKMLEDSAGKDLFDNCMRTYFKQWQFKHPYPEDFKKVFEAVIGKKADYYFSFLNSKGNLPSKKINKDIRFAFLYNLKGTEKHRYIAAAPIIGYNFYDKLMIGAVVHNYSLPPSKFQFIAAPLFSNKNKQLNGLGKISYCWYPGTRGAKAAFSFAAEKFSYDVFTDSINKANYLSFRKLTPSFKYVFAAKNPRSTITGFLQWKTFLFREQSLHFERDTIRQIDIISYPYLNRYLNQFQFVVENNRALYPYRGALQAEQGKGFIRLNFTGNYFFNYAAGGGINLRLFAGKFIYTGDKTFTNEFANERYHLNMTGPKGNEDYTYDNYFFGRNEFEKPPSQQIMIRDGGFKVRTDLLSNKIGKTDDWLAAANLTTTIPKAINPLEILPVKIPLKAFLDIGTYAGAWKDNAASGKFLYDAGLQLSLIHGIVNVYVPLLYSKVYTNYFKSTIPEKRFLKNIAFSFDLQQIRFPMKNLIW